MGVLGTRFGDALRLGGLVVAVVGVAGLARWTGAANWLSPDNVQATVGQFGPLAPVAYVILYAAATTLSIPGTGFTLAAGVLFGRWEGTLLAIFGATLGSFLTFALTRQLVRDQVARRFSDQGWFQAFEHGVSQNGLAFMLFVRLVPLFPPTGINYGAGLTAVRGREYVLGTALGILPGTFVYVSLAENAVRVASGNEIDPGPGVAVMVALLGILALLPIVARRTYSPNPPVDGGSGALPHQVE